MWLIMFGIWLGNLWVIVLINIFNFVGYDLDINKVEKFNIYKVFIMWDG